jgi:hypothetical protein
MAVSRSRRMRRARRAGTWPQRHVDARQPVAEARDRDVQADGGGVEAARGVEFSAEKIDRIGQLERRSCSRASVSIAVVRLAT